MKILIVMTTSLILLGCEVKSLPKDVGPSDTVYVADNTTLVLTKNYKETQFRVGVGATLDLNGHTINGLRGSGRFLCVKLADHASIRNGSIDQCALAVAIDNNITDSVKNQLIQMSKFDGKAYVETLKTTANRNQSVSDLRFIDNTTDVYVTRYTTGASIQNVVSSGALKMAIYLDADSTGATISNSSFTNCGTYRSKSCIMIDGSSNNILRSNQIFSTASGIELYKNCGERNMPRWNGANNNIIETSTFSNVSLGINVSSRKFDRFTSCRSDDAGDIVEGTIVRDNTYNSVAEQVRWN
jgi:parallel beta-helix repeat protein